MCLSASKFSRYWIRPTISLKLATLVVGATVAGFSQSASLTATYTFQNTLNAVDGGPTLLGVDPLHRGGFLTDAVLGAQRTVYSFSGTPNGPAAFRRVFDVSDRTS